MLRLIIILLFGSGMLFPATTLSAGAGATADKIKAAYIYQFTQFVTWPDPPVSADTPLTICVLGKGPIGNELEPLNRRRLGRGLISVSYPQTLRDTAVCNILYIAETEQRQLQSTLNYLHNKPVLTVSSIPNFAARGGIIGFVIVNKRVRLEINRAAARNANIQLSAKLLEVAMRVVDTASEGSQ